MDIDYDPDKSRKNFEKRGLHFEDVGLLDWDTALFHEDVRNDYGEKRFVVYAMKDERLHIVCVTPRQGKWRVISFRKANRREQAYYEQETADR